MYYVPYSFLATVVKHTEHVHHVRISLLENDKRAVCPSTTMCRGPTVVKLNTMKAIHHSMQAPLLYAFCTFVHLSTKSNFYH